jgi:hypothetical protein
MADSTTAPPVDKDAHALTAFRVLPDGRGRQYTATTFPRNPYQGCERTIRMASKCGFVTAPSRDCYALLDVIDAEGEYLEGFGIPTAQAFRWFKRVLHWQVESTDGD